VEKPTSTRISEKSGWHFLPAQAWHRRDTAALDTLSLCEFRAGYAEMVKYGLIDQPDFFNWLEKTGGLFFPAVLNAFRQFPFISLQGRNC